MPTIFSLQQDAVDELKDRLESEEVSEIADLIHEVADGQVPIYTKQILKIVMSDITLATCEPELGPAFDGRPTAINLIAANIYESLVENLREWYESNE